MATVWVDDDKTKSGYKIKKKTWNYVCVVKPNDKTSDTNDDVKTKTNTKHMKRDTWQVNVHVVFLLVRVVVILTHGTPLCVAQVVRVFVSSHPCMKWASLFDFELSIPSNFLFFSFSHNLLQSLLHFFYNLEGSSNTAHSAKKEMESYDESYSPQLQTGFVSRLRLCSKSTSGGVLFCPSQLDVQETNFCFAQLHRVWDHFSGCWNAYGWVTCFWSLGHGVWSVTFNWRQSPTHTYKEHRRLSSWVRWITYPPTHILLEVNLSCTSLKTTKPWSNW